uniref:CCHC-type domain-containing protein n=1 Tax=Ananas comosus var. bracteatus TaxID=296719 RepID=A0A6V7PPJ8_ANACO|nr:unnamed protein product [Ananas comosus var. bracteatus]
MESGAAEVQERREAMDKGKAKRPAAEGASQTHSRRPPKHPKSQQHGRGSTAQRGGYDRRRPSPCVICGGPHHPTQYPQRAGRCFQCGQEGHMRTECPRGSSPAPSTASAPALPAASQRTPSTQYQPGRPTVQRQSEGFRQAPSGRLYAAQTEEAAAAEDVVAGIILLDGIRVRALFDTGASHSFIDWVFAELHGIPLVPLLHTGHVVVPDHVLDIREYCPSCPVRVGDWIMLVDCQLCASWGILTWSWAWIG